VSSPDWVQRLANSSLRKQYVVSLCLVVLALVLATLVSAMAVIWAAATTRDHADRIVALQVANRDLLQDMTYAEAGLRGYALSHDSTALQPYLSAMGQVPQEEQSLRLLTEDDPALSRAVEAQHSAISAWIQRYAEPRTTAGPAMDQKLFMRGRWLFNDFRGTNKDVALRIDAATDVLHERMQRILIAALVVVILVPLLAAAAVLYAARQLSRSVVDPLTELSAVLERLRAGDNEARAVVRGPAEVRRIAAELNMLTVENLRASEVEADVLTQLETIDRVRTDLVSTVSHELRTPLTSIKGYLELLQDELMDQLSPQQTTMLGAIRRNLDRLNELIANLLALSRAEETQLNVEQIDLRAVAAEVAMDIRLTARSQDITVRTVQSAAPVVVHGDRSQLIRAVQNLATNAIKFSRPGGAVELRVTESDGEAVLEVADEGIGIPAADLSGLGSRFYRASNAVKAEIAGTGLGLRIVQTILSRHEGNLAVSSVEGEGTTFTLRVPLARTLDPVAVPEILPVAVGDRD
jgi:signal transduction histidine kinase